MNAGETVTVRGEGGDVFPMDIPEEGTLAREVFDDGLAKGRLTILKDDGEPVVATTDDEVAETEPDEPEDDGPPTHSAAKADWLAWAIAQGADPDEAAAATKAELIDTYGGE